MKKQEKQKIDIIFSDGTREEAEYRRTPGLNPGLEECLDGITEVPCRSLPAKRSDSEKRLMVETHDAGEQTWHYGESAEDFVDLMQWALVFEKAGTEQPPGWTEIVHSPAKVVAYANEHGMTREAISREMIRCGHQMLRELHSEK